MQDHPFGKLECLLSVSFYRRSSNFHPSKVKLRRTNFREIVCKSVNIHPLYDEMRTNFQVVPKFIGSKLDYTVTANRYLPDNIFFWGNFRERGFGYRISVQKQ